MARILIVDDSDFIRIILRKYLTKIGHEVVGEANDSDIAIELYKELKPDIVILDFVMPTDGSYALKEILKYDEKARIIICSSAANTSNVIMAIKLGAKSFIAKPVCSETLNKTISDAMMEFPDKAISNNGCFGFANKNKFLLSMYNDSLADSGIQQNDLLIIQKSDKAVLNDMVFVVNGDFLTIGYYKEIEGKPVITNESSLIYVAEDTKSEIIGVVKGMLRLFNPKKIQLNKHQPAQV